MLSHTEILCTLVLPDVEVISLRDEEGKVETFINGGACNGDTFVGDAELRAQHVAACEFARSAA